MLIHVDTCWYSSCICPAIVLGRQALVTPWGQKRRQHPSEAWHCIHVVGQITADQHLVMSHMSHMSHMSCCIMLLKHDYKMIIRWLKHTAFCPKELKRLVETCRETKLPEGEAMWQWATLVILTVVMQSNAKCWDLLIFCEFKAYLPSKSFNAREHLPLARCLVRTSPICKRPPSTRPQWSARSLSWCQQIGSEKH